MMQKCSSVCITIKCKLNVSDIIVNDKAFIPDKIVNIEKYLQKKSKKKEMFFHDLDIKVLNKYVKPYNDSIEHMYLIYKNKEIFALYINVLHIYILCISYTLYIYIYIYIYICI